MKPSDRLGFFVTGPGTFTGRIGWMHDSYLLDDKVGEIADFLERGLLSISDPTPLHDVLHDAHEAVGVPVSKVATKVAKVIRTSNRLDKSTRQAMADWLEEHYVTYARKG